MPIGGFLPLAIAELPAAAVTPWQLWTDGAQSTLAFQNARSALVWLLRQKQNRRLFLPAYICPEIADAARGAGVDVRFYGVGEALAPDAAALDSAARRGDAVLGVDYFGSAPSPDFLVLVNARRDLLWIEDRAQAFAPGVAAWGDWLLYSPRKLLGVPDGGLLVSYRERLAAPVTEELQDLSFVMPTLERFEDTDEARNREWYSRYREVEARTAVSLRKMSRLTATLLRRLDATGVAERRRRNCAVLVKAFAAIALRTPGAHELDVPFGLPIRVVDPATVAALLADRGVFCARHWPSLPSDPQAFASEHHLAQSLLTLPCDQRYDEAEMRRLVDIVTATLP
jgi:dTDP-4-amino-4,6-dideoxygalactose transaminase